MRGRDGEVLRATPSGPGAEPQTPMLLALENHTKQRNKRVVLNSAFICLENTYDTETYV